MMRCRVTAPCKAGSGCYEAVGPPYYCDAMCTPSASFSCRQLTLELTSMEQQRVHERSEAAAVAQRARDAEAKLTAMEVSMLCGTCS